MGTWSLLLQDIIVLGPILTVGLKAPFFKFLVQTLSISSMVPFQVFLSCPLTSRKQWWLFLKTILTLIKCYHCKTQCIASNIKIGSTHWCWGHSVICEIYKIVIADDMAPYVVCLASIMMTSSNGNFSPHYWPLCREFPAQRPVMQSFDVFSDLRLNQQLSKQWKHQWFEMPSHSLWLHSNVKKILIISKKSVQWNTIQIFLSCF